MTTTGTTGINCSARLCTGAGRYRRLGLSREHTTITAIAVACRARSGQVFGLHVRQRDHCGCRQSSIGSQICLSPRCRRRAMVTDAPEVIFTIHVEISNRVVASRARLMEKADQDPIDVAMTFRWLSEELLSQPSTSGANPPIVFPVGDGAGPHRCDLGLIRCDLSYRTRRLVEPAKPAPSRHQRLVMRSDRQGPVSRTRRSCLPG